MGVRIVFLDLNHWIGLAKARVGHPDGTRYRDALDRLTQGVQNGTLILPLSAVHYGEIADIRDLHQRADIALTMDRLSRYATIAGRDVILRAQLQYALARWRGLETPMAHRALLFGRGAAWAFGMPEIRGDVVGPEASRQAFFAHGMSVVDKLEEVIGTGWTFADRGAAFASKETLILAAFGDAAEFVLLRGPRPEDEAALRGFGYDPTTFRDVIQGISDREADLARRLAAGTADRQRLDDIIAGRLYVWDLNHLLPAVLADFGLAFDDLAAGGKAALRRVLDDMPTMDVEQVLRRANFRNGSYQWKTNDVHDLAMLGVAVPYSDVVVTEKHAASRLNAAHVPQRLGSVVFGRIEPFVEWLDASVPIATSNPSDPAAPSSVPVAASVS